MSAPPWPELSLEGRVVLVTGAGGGIGRAVARRLGEAGARVLGVDLPGEDWPAGDDTYACDLSDRSAVEGLFADLRRDASTLDAIVHCAGITRDAVLWKLSEEDWRAVLGANLDSAFFVLREAAPRLRERGGSVALVGSINGERGKFGQANYAASKAGLIGLARTAARELGAFGVRVNVISPGLIRTAMTDSLPDEVLQRARDESALGRLGDPDDVARVAFFLCSDLSRHVTGQVLRVDGGQLMS